MCWEQVEISQHVKVNKEKAFPMLAGQEKTDSSFPHILSLSRSGNLGEGFSEDADGTCCDQKDPRVVDSGQGEEKPPGRPHEERC